MSAVGSCNDWKRLTNSPEKTFLTVHDVEETVLVERVLVAVGGEDVLGERVVEDDERALPRQVIAQRDIDAAGERGDLVALVAGAADGGADVVVVGHAHAEMKAQFALGKPPARTQRTGLAAVLVDEPVGLLGREGAVDSIGGGQTGGVSPPRSAVVYNPRRWASVMPVRFGTMRTNSCPGTRRAARHTMAKAIAQPRRSVLESFFILPGFNAVAY